MADEPAIVVAPLSKGIRRTRANADPFAAEVGEALEANCGVFTDEGGFRQHGGIQPYTGSAADGAIVQLKRWYKPDGTKVFLALSSGGTLYVVSDALPATLTPIYTGLSGLPLSLAEINGWLYLSNGTDPFLRYDGTLVYQVGAEKPTIGSMAAAEIAGGGSLTAGRYRFKVTFEYGTEGSLGESDPTDGEVAITVSANAAIELTNIPVATRADATFKNIYRTLDDGDEFYWSARIPMAQTTYTVTEGDTFLSDANFLMEEDHDIPGRLKHIVSYKGRLFGEDPLVPGRVKFSLTEGSDIFPDDPTFFSDELAQGGETLTSLFRYGEALYGAKKNNLWVLTGDSNDTFIWDEVPSGPGFLAEFSLAKSDVGMFGVGPRDIQLFDGFNVRSVVEVRGYLDDVYESSKASAKGVYRDKMYYVAVQPGSSSKRTRLLMVHAEPLPGSEEGLATVSTELTYLSGGVEKQFEVSCLGVWENENDRLFLGGYDGYIYEFDLGVNWARVGEDVAAANFRWKSNWIYDPGGPPRFKTFLKPYVMVESEGGTLTMDYEIMTDNPNNLIVGSSDIDLSFSVTDPTQRVARWNISRWG